MSLLNQIDYQERLGKITYLRKEIARLSDEALDELRKWLRKQDGISTDERVSRKSGREDG